MKVYETKIGSRSLGRINQVLKDGQLGFGPNVEEFQNKFEMFSQQKFNIGTNSASAAAFMIFSYLKEKYGECDVYTPSLGFHSPAWSAKHFGHNLVWVEVDENLLFDVEDYRNKRRQRCERYSDIGKKIVVMPILYGGVSTIPNFEDIKKDNYSEIIVVDSAHCVTPTIESDFTFFSFHPYKPIAASDGGMISTNNEEANTYFNLYRNFGRQNTQDGYDIIQEGFKFYMNNLNATIALTQLEQYTLKVVERRKVFKYLETLGLQGRLLPHDELSSYYFGTLICDEDSIEELNNKYNTSRHYPLLHKTNYFKDGSSLPFTETIHKHILNLPLYDKYLYYS